MPKKTFTIEWDWPDEDFWLPADSVALALRAYCKNTNFVVTEKTGNNPVTDLPDDPMLNTAYNFALQWAAKWLVDMAVGHNDETTDFAKSISESFLAARRDVAQQSFQDAVKNDLYMSAEDKAFWLSQLP